MRLSHIEARLEQQLVLTDLISNAYDNLTKVGLGNVNVQRINTRFSALKEDWEKFSVTHEAIGSAVMALPSEDRSRVQGHSYFTENFFAATRELYLETTERINLLLETDHGTSLGSSSSRLDTNTHSGQQHYQQSRLPRINLPKFSGIPTDWLSFKDLFSSIVIANPALTPVEKLHYLRTCLVSPADHLLKDVTVRGENFQRSWEALVAFYENKRLLVNAALHSLLNLKRMSKESASEMERLYTSSMQIYRSLENLRRPVDSWDDFLVFIIVQRLDTDSVKAWEQLLGSTTEPPTWKKFTDFLVSRFRTLQAVEKARTGKSYLQTQPVAKAHYQGKSNQTGSNKERNCPICSGTHHASMCSRYSMKTVPQKKSIINKHKLCFNCLGHHRVASCRSTKRCFKCGHKHHTSIHSVAPHTASSQKENKEPITSTANPPKTEESRGVHSATISDALNPRVLLATARVRVTSSNGSTTIVRALIDQGSEISLISEKIVQRLRITRSHSSLSLVGIGANASNRTRGVVDITLSSYFPSNFTYTVAAHILVSLTSSIPSMPSNQMRWPHLNGLQLADPNFYQPGSVDLVLGADVYGAIILKGLIKESLNAPIAQQTAFGWIISGPMGSEQSPEQALTAHVRIDEDLNSILQRFWVLEEVPYSMERSFLPDEQACETHFQTTHSRDVDGRYVVRLPFKKSVEYLGDSKKRATCLIYKLRQRFESNPTYAKLYADFINEYAMLKHMRLVPNNMPEPPHVYYLPHHGVLREISLTTKLRVVFNGSSKTTSGLSLNDLLHVGPKLQTDLFNVLIWFRQFRFVFSSDIEKMFRQIRVHEEDWNCQRIFWINETNSLSTYQLTTVTYGLACAPFLALRVISQLLKDEGHKFPLAVPVLSQGRYVDDIFGGADTVEGAQAVVQQVNRLCTAGGFHLQKWTSNHPDILNVIPERDRISPPSVFIDDNLLVHSLGLIWRPGDDVFLPDPRNPLVKPPTKRIILSTIAKLFDPLGFLSPIIITAKILLQTIWTLRLQWDDPLPEEIANKWDSFINDLQELSTLKFPRWLGLEPHQSFEIHGFSDASQQAYAAVAYSRIVSSDGSIHTQLICAKTRVAPLKRVTIPRLELAGAVLLSKLVRHLLTIFSQYTISIFLWIDSTVAYTWITGHPSRWKEFVHNRVCFIQETLPQAQWCIVAGKDNPADLATRGLSPNQLAERGSWWSGPPWLAESSPYWPQKPTSLNDKQVLEERLIKVSTTHVEPTENWDLLNRYSSLTRLVRITAVCQRAVKRFKRIPNSSLTYPITTSELQTARRFWVKIIQSSAFQQDLKLLSSKGSLPSSHPLSRLTPFKDNEGILRVGGRLQASSLHPEAKNPAILPKYSPFTTLVIADAHTRTLHGGTQSTLCTVREQFWIIGGRIPIRSYILKCVKCTRFRRARAQQLMGQLPKERVTPSRPFMTTGVDYAGPLMIKSWRGRNARTYKGYIALFVCFSTSAMHLELVTDYTTEAFMAAYKRFTGRRGVCATLWSDCGTNFKGAEVALRRLFTESTAESRHLAALLANDGTQWRFNPPSAPHFGGKWEAGVKSVKHHLLRVVGETVLTYEEMTTYLIQIEAVLNSRPLTPCSEDPDDLNVLTPGHFLMGCAPTVLPEPSHEAIPLTRLSRWQLVRKMIESFWTRWSREYLQRYHAISKWRKPGDGIREGSVVLVVDERYPPAKWPLGRVVETHPGEDGLVRVATVKTQTSILKRPVVKLCPLSDSVDIL